MNKFDLLFYLHQISTAVMQDDKLTAINIISVLLTKIEDIYRCGQCGDKINETGLCAACKSQLNSEIV